MFDKHISLILPFHTVVAYENTSRLIIGLILHNKYIPASVKSASAASTSC